MHSVTGVPGGIAMPPSSNGSTVMRLPSWFELSNRSISSTAVLISAGFSISRCFSPGLLDSVTRPLPIRLVVVSWPALSRKMQLCSSSFSVSRSPLSSPWIRRVSTSSVGIAGLGPPPRHQRFEIGEEVLHGRCCRAQTTSGTTTGSSAPRIASDQSRSGSRSSWGTSSRLPITSIGIAAAKSPIRSHLALGGDGIEQAVDQPDQIGLHAGDRARRQRAHDQPAHAGVGGRIVEDEARGVVLVEQGVAVFRRKLLLLVRGERSLCSCRR